MKPIQLQSFFTRTRTNDPSIVAFRLKISGTLIEAAVCRRIALSSEQIAVGLIEEEPRYRITIPGDADTQPAIAALLSGLNAVEVSFNKGATYRDAQIIDTITNNGIFWQFVIQ
jgi:hypothetical protein